MPDLLTHLAMAHIVRRTSEIAQHKIYIPQTYTMFYLGSILPDLIVRPFTMVFHSRGVYWFLSPTHLPLGLVLLCYIIAMCFHKSHRKKFFGLLMLGSGLHCFLDVLQKHLTSGDYHWFFPFSWKTFSLQLFWPSDSILALPFLLVIFIILEVFFFKWAANNYTDKKYSQSSSN